MIDVKTDTHWSSKAAPTFTTASVKIKIIFIFFGFLIHVSCIANFFSSRPEWQNTQAEMGKRFLFLSLSSTSKMYLRIWVAFFQYVIVAGGHDNSAHGMRKTTQLYDVALNTWYLEMCTVPNFPRVALESICIYRTTAGGAADLPVAINRGHMITVGSRSDVLPFFYLLLCVTAAHPLHSSGSSSWADGPTTRVPPTPKFTSTLLLQTHGRQSQRPYRPAYRITMDHFCSKLYHPWVNSIILE